MKPIWHDSQPMYIVQKGRIEENSDRVKYNQRKIACEWGESFFTGGKLQGPKTALTERF